MKQLPVEVPEALKRRSPTLIVQVPTPGLGICGFSGRLRSQKDQPQEGPVRRKRDATLQRSERDRNHRRCGDLQNRRTRDVIISVARGSLIDSHSSRESTEVSGKMAGCTPTATCHSLPVKALKFRFEELQPEFHA